MELDEEMEILEGMIGVHQHLIPGNPEAIQGIGDMIAFHLNHEEDSSEGSDDEPEGPRVELMVGSLPSTPKLTPFSRKLGETSGAAASTYGGQPVHRMPDFKGDSKLALKSRLGYYLLNEELADVHFLIPKGEGEEPHKVPAHKFILAAGSIVFKAMFYGLMAEATNEITLPDVELSGLKTLLKYLYTDDVDLSAQNLVSTLYAAKKYCVNNLEKACLNYLSWNLSNDNVLLVLSQALLFEEQILELCWQKIEANTNQVIEADSFLEIDADTLLLILKRDSLSVKEVDLYKAVAKWARKECERQGLLETPEYLRQVLGEAVLHLRFPTMSGEEFSFHVSNDGLIGDDQVMSVFSYFADPTAEVPFPTKPRSGTVMPAIVSGSKETGETKKEITISRFEKPASGRLCTFDDVHKVDFIVNQSVFIAGFGVYGTRCKSGERMLYVELINTESGERMATGRIKITCNGAPTIYQVRFKDSVQINPDVIYTASAEFDGSYPYPTYYGVNGRRICSVLASEHLPDQKPVTFVFFKSERNNFLDTGGECGQIPQVLFHL